MENRFHNHSVAEIAAMAFEAQQRIKAAEQDFEACKIKLIEIAKGAKLQINVPQLCKVTVSEPPKESDKKTYRIDSDAFEKLDLETQRRLIDTGVIKERSNADESRSPTVRVVPIS